MPRRKPLGWPRYMVARRLKSGATAYYWDIPSWAKRNGCALEIEALGTDYADAKKRCDELLNPQFDAWRKREDIALPSDHAAPRHLRLDGCGLQVIAALSEVACKNPQVLRRGIAARQPTQAERWPELRRPFA